MKILVCQVKVCTIVHKFMQGYYLQRFNEREVSENFQIANDFNVTELGLACFVSGVHFCVFFACSNFSC